MENQMSLFGEQRETATTCGSKSAVERLVVRKDSSERDVKERLARAAARINYEKILEKGFICCANNAVVAAKINKYVGLGKQLVEIRPFGARNTAIYLCGA